MVVKVFGSLRGACPQRVLACLLELDLDYEFVHVDLDSGEHKQPPFLLRQVTFLPCLNILRSSWHSRI